jgi:hypothetical protein
VKLTVQRLMLATALAALLLACGSGGVSQRRDRCFEIADWHSRIGSEYRKNARGDAVMLRIADWHEHMRRRFEAAAHRFWEPLPSTSPFPPEDWFPPGMIEAMPRREVAVRTPATPAQAEETAEDAP